MIGRAYIYGLGAGGQAGVELALDLIGKELSTTMGLTGINHISEIDRRVLTDHWQTNALCARPLPCGRGRRNREGNEIGAGRGVEAD
jgi:hypothetical protein